MTTNPSPKPNSPAPSVVKPDLDRQGGARLSAGAARILQLRKPALRYLHLTDGPHLRELDLSHCAPGIDLTLEACPQLRLIRLPTATAGAVLHLDLGAAPSLEVLGSIQSLDACWHGGSCDIDARHAPPFRHARLGGGLRLLAEEHELRIEHGPAVPATLSIPAGSRLRALLVLSAPKLERIELPAGRALERVHLTDCPRLSAIRGEQAHRLRVESCAALMEIGLSGHAASLTAATGAADGLRLARPWTHLTVTATRARRLHCPAVRELTLRDCPDLLEAEVAEQAAVSLSGQTCVAIGATAQLSLDERAVAGLLVRAETGDPLALGMLTHWCGHARKPWEFLETLRALAAVQADPDWLWRLRCRLHARCNLSRGAMPDDDGCLQHARRHWDWRFPPDRYLEGWEADLGLWRRARDRQPELDELLAQQPPLLAVTALARQLGEGSLSPRLERLLCKAITRARQPGRQHDAELPGAARVALELLAAAAVGLGSVAMADALIERMQRHHEPDWRQLAVLGTLGAYGHAGARAALVSLAQTGDPELRAQAMGLALAPVRRATLAVEEVAYA